MNYIENKKYLKSNDLHFYVGWIILVAGLVLFVMGELFWLYILPYQWIISIALLIVGALVTFLPRVGRGSEESLDEGVKEHCEKLGQTAVIALGKRLKNQGEGASIVGHYLLLGEDLLLRRGRKDERIRSSRYVAAAIAFSKEGVYVLKSDFSLISNEESQTVTEISYQDHPEGRVEEKELQIAGRRVKIKELVLLVQGVERIRIATENSVFVDELCQRINVESRRANES
ncbi:MAG: hypothetical protein IJZ33_06730 [Clostridia bacterium]|nr:hypothetical protein [Clostridia bacterium]